MTNHQKRCSCGLMKYGRAIRYVVDSRIRLETRLGTNKILVEELKELQKLLPEYKEGKIN